jgi:Amt family ammonium transporter
MGACIGAVVGPRGDHPGGRLRHHRRERCSSAWSARRSNLVVHWKSRTALDDTLDVFPCHGVGGIVGTVATGLFAKEGGLLHGGGAKLFLLHLAAVAIVGVYSFVGSWLLLRLTGLVIPLRVSHEQEEQGLDRSQHGEVAVPADEAEDAPIAPAVVAPLGWHAASAGAPAPQASAAP